MTVSDVIVSASHALNEQVAAEVFDTLSESGPILNLMDREGNCWSADPEKLDALGLDQGLLHDLWAKVDDGAEPAVAQVGDATVMVTQLATEQTNCGYLVLVVPRSNTEWTQINFDLAEALFAQITLVAKLIEKSERYLKCYSVYGTAEAPVN